MPSNQTGAGTPVEWEQLIPVTLIAALALESYKKPQAGGKKSKKSKKSHKKRSSKKRSSKKRSSKRKSSKRH